MMSRDVKRLRRRLWDSLWGCSCSPLEPRASRCSASAIRCNTRHKRVCDEFARYGLLRGPVPEGHDGLDPNASRLAIRRREQAIEQLRGR